MATAFLNSHLKSVGRKNRSIEISGLDSHMNQIKDLHVELNKELTMNLERLNQYIDKSEAGHIQLIDKQREIFNHYVLEVAKEAKQSRLFFRRLLLIFFGTQLLTDIIILIFKS